jgi:hypothetical protein
VQIFFDVHGTLLSTDERRVRPFTSVLMQTLFEEEHEVTLWSTGGAGYAWAFADRFGLLAWIFDTQSKRIGRVPPDVCVDDHPDYLIGTKGNVQVSSFRGDPYDRELEGVLAALREFAEQE